MFGQYTLHKLLAEGGYSKVYKCTDEIGIRYVCKQMPKISNKRERVIKEISVMQTLNTSPKIVHYVDAGEDDKNYYIVQEWCRGGSVQEYIKQYPSYGENTVASIMRGTLRGLHHMHHKGITHCDIKAGNILFGDVSEDADVKIGDLGCAIFTNDNEVTVDNLVGTPWFMAPENLQHVYHTKSDIWSVGVMAYHLLCGKLPFNDFKNPSKPSLPSIWFSILHKEPSLTSSRWADITDDAKDFVTICLQKDYSKRSCAKQLLQHPWLTKSDISDRFKGTPLKCQPFKYQNEAEMKAMTLNPHMNDKTI